MTSSIWSKQLSPVTLRRMLLSYSIWQDYFRVSCEILSKFIRISHWSFRQNWAKILTKCLCLIPRNVCDTKKYLGLKMTSFGRLEIRMMYEVPLSSKRWNICLQTIKKSHTFLRRGVLITQNSGGKLEIFVNNNNHSSRSFIHSSPHHFSLLLMSTFRSKLPI